MGGFTWFLLGAMAVVVVVLAVSLYRKSHNSASRSTASPVSASVSTRRTAGSDWDKYDRAMDEAYKEHYEALKQSLIGLRNFDDRHVPIIHFRIKCALTGIQLLVRESAPNAPQRSEMADNYPSSVLPPNCPTSARGPGWAYCHVLYVITGRKASLKKVRVHMEREQLYVNAAIEKAKAARGE